MKKIIFTCALLGSSLAAAGVCKDSQVFIENHTEETLVLGNLCDTCTYGTRSAKNHDAIAPGATYEFKVDSASGTAGAAFSRITVGGDNGNTDVWYYFSPQGVTSVIGYGYCNVRSGFATNPKFYDVEETRTDGNPGKLVITISAKGTKTAAE